MEPGCSVLSSPGFCFFHLVLLFWNQIFTCVSVRLRDRARFSLSHTDRYRVARNLFSKATSCSYVNAVLARLGLAQACSERRRLCGVGSCGVISGSALSGFPVRKDSASTGGDGCGWSASGSRCPNCGEWSTGSSPEIEKNDHIQINLNPIHWDDFNINIL